MVVIRIFNRTSQEKVYVGTEGYYGGDSEDFTGVHLEGKDRDTTSEIASVGLVPAAGNFTTGKFWLLGIKV